MLEKCKPSNLEALEAEVKNNDGKGCKDANGGGVVGIHSPFHPTNLHLFFLNENLVSAMRKQGIMRFRTWPFTGGSGSRVDRVLLRLLLTPSLGENLSMSVSPVVTDLCEARLS